MGETLQEIGVRLGRETTEAYRASPFGLFSRDYPYGNDHTFPHLTQMLEAKQVPLERELGKVLPELARRLG
ncbi:MAG: hypothetical protein FJY95_02220 [Candidatus Handelsmanbacteria bacterium]|nr:hypothetical protein [Candidatus Handelsmanbacteria bacterium]